MCEMQLKYVKENLQIWIPILEKKCYKSIILNIKLEKTGKKKKKKLEKQDQTSKQKKGNFKIRRNEFPGS